MLRAMELEKNVRIEILNATKKGAVRCQKKKFKPVGEILSTEVLNVIR